MSIPETPSSPTTPGANVRRRDELVRQPAGTSVAAQLGAPSETPRAPRKRRRTGWIVGGIVLGLVALAGAGVTAFLLLTPTAQSGPADAVLGYDRAYAEADCELFVAVTTVTYREALAPTCADFEAEAQTFADNFSDYEIVIDSTVVEGTTASVVTTESWMIEGQANSAEYTYTLVADDGAWRIDAFE